MQEPKFFTTIEIPALNGISNDLQGALIYKPQSVAFDTSLPIYFLTHLEIGSYKENLTTILNEKKINLVLFIDRPLDEKKLQEGWSNDLYNQFSYFYHPDYLTALVTALGFFRSKAAQFFVSRNLMQGFFVRRMHLLRYHAADLLDISCYEKNEIPVKMYHKAVKQSVYRINKGRQIQGKGIKYLHRFFVIFYKLIAQKSDTSDVLVDMIKYFGQSEVYYRYGFELQKKYYRHVFRNQKKVHNFPFYQNAYAQLIAQMKQYYQLLSHASIILLNFYKNAFINIKVADRLILVDRMVSGKFKDLMTHYHFDLPQEKTIGLRTGEILLSWTKRSLNFSLLKAKLYIATNKKQNPEDRSTNEFSMFLYHLDLALKEANFLLNKTHHKAIDESLEQDYKNMVRELFRSKLYLDMLQK